MRKGDDVFLFTLVDFLLQLFFFGLVLYVLLQVQASAASKIADATDDASKSVANWTGFTSITELSDHLTKLAPPEDFRGWADFLSKEKALEPVVAASDFVRSSGGVKEIERKLKLYDDAYGQPPCEKVELRGKVVPVSVAVFRLEDDAIAVEEETTSLAAIRRRLGEESKSTFTLNEFRNLFGRLRQLEPQCRFFADIRVETKYLAPLDAFQSGFRINARR